jgi:CheY-like chemotaxis protein
MTRTILLADDSVTIQKVVELTFLEEDLDVVAVGSGDEALARLDDLAPALVIADVHMPGADGYEVCRRVKKKDSTIPVLLLVGTFEPFDADSVQACGAQGFLKKPFDSQELLRMALDLVGKPDAQVSSPAVTDVFETTRMAVQPPEMPEPPPLAEPAESEPPEQSAEASAAESAPPAGNGQLSDDDVERIARRVVELMADKAVRDVAWEVVPDLAELLIRDRLRELESQVD